MDSAVNALSKVGGALFSTFIQYPLLLLLAIAAIGAGLMWQSRWDKATRAGGNQDA